VEKDMHCTNNKKTTHKKLMITIAVISCVALVVLWPGCATVKPRLHDESSRTGLSQDVQSIIEEYRHLIPTMMKERKIPGLSLALVDRDGILWTAGFGYTGYDCETPVTPETMFAICSLTKTFTATAVMFAVQDGIVDLDVPITEYLPDFTVNSRFEDNPQDKITLRHLLYHRSGLPHDALRSTYREPNPSLEDYVMSISEIWLKFKVGERESYSSCGFDLAGYILQVRSGKPFAEYLKETVFDPLGMPNSSVDFASIRNQPNRAIGHEPHAKEVKDSVEIHSVAGCGVYSSAKDVAKFIQFHLNQGKVGTRQILDESLLHTMYTPSALSRTAGLGIGVGRHDNGDYYLAHLGMAYGFNTAMQWYPEYGIGAVVLSNSKTYPKARILSRLMDDKLIEKNESFGYPPWMSAYHDWSEYVPPPLPDSNTFTPYQPAWKKYVGTYRYIMLPGASLHNYAKIGLALGYYHPEAKARVYEKNGYLEIDGERLDEHMPGLFFTDDAECLDFRGPVPIWRGRKMERSW
jgi:CubicO group peptidase (beta-lactamase class C family)